MPLRTRVYASRHFLFHISDCLHKFDSCFRFLACAMQSAARPLVCPVRYCGRLVNAALLLHLSSLPKFDINTYCSQRCDTLHSHGSHRPPLGPLITCDVCIEEKPLTDYVHQRKEKGTSKEWSIPLPDGCVSHLAPELLNMEGGTCTDCLRSHIASQLETR